MTAAIPPKKAVLEGVYPETEADILTLDDHGTDGYAYQRGQTGMASLGGGYFYMSYEGRNDDGQYTNIKLCRLENGDFTAI